MSEVIGDLQYIAYNIKGGRECRKNKTLCLRQGHVITLGCCQDKFR